MKKTKGVPFEDILKKELKSREVRVLYQQSRFYLEIARLIAELRDRSGLSQAQVAKLASVSQPLIARLEKGDQRRVPTFDTVYRILKVLGYDLELKAIPSKKVAA